MTKGSGFSLSPSEKDLTKIVAAIRQLMEGRSNAVGEVTLTHDGSATATTVTAPTCGPNSVVHLEPETAHAAAVRSTTYVSSVSPGSFIVTHAATSNADVTFSYVCLG